MLTNRFHISLRAICQCYAHNLFLLLPHGQRSQGLSVRHREVMQGEVSPEGQLLLTYTFGW